MRDKAVGTTEAILSDDRATLVSPAQVEENLRLIEDLKFFLATAPANWQKNQIIRRYYLNHDEGFVSCVFWNNLYFITGTDIVRCIVYRFEQFGREITNRKKFEEGIFSDLRSLKCGSDAVLEASKSPFLDFLYKNSCLRTQKKQKVFFWFSVPHDKLFAEALERDMKKESQNQIGTTKSKTEPALSFEYDDSKPLYDQLVDHLEFKKKLYASSEASSIHGGEASSAAQTPLISSQATEVVEPEIFHIKQEDDILNVIPAKEDDDFPLDYFPMQDSKEPFMIDTSIFTNPPESYDNQYLIDQTYAKTPYSAARFIDTDPISNDDEETEEQYVPASDYRAGLAPQTLYVQQSQQQQLHHQVPFSHMMTNGQYYDSQMGEEYEEVPEFSEHAVEAHYTPPYLYQHLPPQHQSYQYYGGGYPPYGVPVIPQGAPSYYYEEQGIPPQYNGTQYYPAFIDEIQEDGDDELYVPFQAPPQYSPFSRGFPSFQAAAPPVQPLSASRLRNQIVPPRASASGRVSKPSVARSLRHQRSQQSLKRIDEDLNKRDVSIGRSSEPATKVPRASSSKDLENIEEGEYNSLPTPESTAPDPWNYNSSNNPQSGSVSSSLAGNGNGNVNREGDGDGKGGEIGDGNVLNDYLEDKIYDEADDQQWK